MVIFFGVFAIWIVVAIGGGLIAMRPKIWAQVALIFVVAFVVSRVANSLIIVPRPFVAGGFVPLIAHEPDNGFPSDHVLLASALSAGVFLVNKKMGIGLFALTMAIGMARVFAGVHHGIDVLGSIGIVIGSYWFTITYLGRRVVAGLRNVQVRLWPGKKN